MIALRDEFLSQYKKRQPKWGFDGLGFIIYLRTYSRTKEDGTLETWWETCKRVTEGNFSIEKARLKDINKWSSEREEKMHLEMERFYHLLFNLVITPPGRGLWMSGTEYEKKIGGDALNNCWGVSMKPYPYKEGDLSKPSFTPCFTFDQAMKGGGVGVSVQKKHTDLLPRVKNRVNLALICEPEHADFDKMPEVIAPTKLTKDFLCNKIEYYKVEDSREGWQESLRRVIDNHFEGKTHLVIDVSDVRPEGVRIKGFGGTASGPPPLTKMLHKVNDILNDNKGKRISPTKWGDIIQLIGNCVVAGNVRRTALILIGDIEDREFVESKNYSLPQNTEAASWRWASNNSIDVRSDFAIDQFAEIAKHIYYNGEPGYVNTELSRNYGRIIDGYQEGIDGEVEVFNPCFTGDMRLFTEDGYKTFKELDGQDVRLVNAAGDVSAGRVWKTGERETVELSFSNGARIRCTPDHVFQTVDGLEVEAQYLKKKRVKPALIKTIKHNPLFVKLGYIQGDGVLTDLNNPDKKGVAIRLGKKDLDMKELFGICDDDLGKEKRSWYTREYMEELQEYGFALKASWEREFPKTYEEWSIKDKASFLKGCYSANGSIIRNRGRVALKTTSFKFANQLVDTLKKDFSISAYITTQFKEGDNYMSKESYDVNIGQYQSRLEFYQKIGFVHAYKEDTLKQTLIETAPMVSSISPNGLAEVYDFNEPSTNWGVVEGFVAHNCGEIPLAFAENCNLFEINLPKIEELIQRGEESPELYKEACYLGSRYAYRVTFKDYEWEATQKIVEKNRRIGVGITGITDWALIKFNKHFDEEAGLFLDGLYREVKETNLEHAKELEGNESIKVTTVKPSGTVSILMGVSPGQHLHWSPYMIRRVRIASNSDLVPVLKECGYHVEDAIVKFEDDGTPVYDQRTKVASFPIKAPTAEHELFKSARDVSLIEQAQVQALLQTYWADNSVSATLSFHKPEPKPVFFADGSQLYDKMGKPVLQVNPNQESKVINEITDILLKYSNTIKSTTMLPHAVGTYPQMPYEEIDQEQYELMVSKIKANPWDVMGIVVADEGELDDSLECVGGACPLR